MSKNDKPPTQLLGNSEQLEQAPFLLYGSDDDKVCVRVLLRDETVWLSLSQMAELFDVGVPAISKHLKNSYETGELERKETVSKMETVQSEGDRQVRRRLDYYNLDAIIAVGYRINSRRATRFRIWATGVLKEFIIKGFALDDERIKSGGSILTEQYFEEQLQRIREIRFSERKFYQKITDIYATAVDCNPNAPTTRGFLRHDAQRTMITIILEMHSLTRHSRESGNPVGC